MQNHFLKAKLLCPAVYNHHVVYIVKAVGIFHVDSYRIEMVKLDVVIEMPAQQNVLWDSAANLRSHMPVQT